MLFEQGAVHAGLVIEALHVRLGDKLDEVAVAGLVLGQDGQVVGGFLLRHLGPTAIVGDVDLAADDRLDPGLFG